MKGVMTRIQILTMDVQQFAKSRHLEIAITLRNLAFAIYAETEFEFLLNCVTMEINLMVRDALQTVYQLYQSLFALAEHRLKSTSASQYVEMV